MKTIILRGISRKGKNRVSGFGDTWEVLKEKDGALFDGVLGTWVLIRPTIRPNSDLRWVCMKGDKDFEVSKEKKNER